jgi:ABC-2 type transport system ATP-binding protein
MNSSKWKGWKFPLWIEWSHVTKKYISHTDTQPTRGERKSQLGLLDFSATARAGITVILGPKGAGKSTLLRLTAATMLPDDGRITFGSRDGERFIWSRGSMVNTDSSSLSDWRDKISYLPPVQASPPDETVEETLLYLAQLSRVPSPKKRATECIAKWGLAAWRKTAISELTGEVLKRYFLAECFVTEPLILLLDEPTNGLDPLGKQILWQELVHQPKERITLFATSNLSLAECAHDLILLEKGSCRRLGRKKYLTASVPEGTVASWYKAMQTFSTVRTQEK